MNIYIDIETEPVRHDEAKPRFVVAGYAIGDGPVEYTYDEKEAAALLNMGLTPVCHKGAFEYGTLGQVYGKKFYDTSIRATILGAEGGDSDAAGHSLETLATQAGLPSWKGGKKITLSFRQGQLMDPEQREYLRRDVEATRAVFKHQGADRAIIADERRQTEWSRYVWEMGRRGIRIDLERLGGLMAPSASRANALRQQLRDAGIVQPRGPKKDPWKKEAVGEKHVLELLKASGATRLANKGKGKQLAMDSEAFRDSGLASLAVLADYEEETKWYSLLDGYNQPGGVVRTKYNSLVTTGRMSSSKPNVQQVPGVGGLRECWIPSPGCAFVEADYPGLELFTFADTCRHWGITSRIGELLDAGVNVHTQVATDAGIPRKVAKVLNFGGLGGMGPKTMRSNLKKNKIVMDFDDVQATMQSWRRALPEIPRYIDHCTTDRRWERYYVVSPQSGRGRLAYYCASLNFPFQAAGGDVIKRAIELCMQAGIPLVAAIHDQLLADVPLSDVQEVSVLLPRLMQQAHADVCGMIRPPRLEGEGTENILKAHVFLDRWVSKGVEYVPMLANEEFAPT